MKLNDFINWVKREGKYGQYGVYSDQATLDILFAFNARRKRIWRKANWGWALEQIRIAVAPGTVVYTVGTVSGNKIDRINNLIPNDAAVQPPVYGRPLRLRTERQFAEETRASYYNLAVGGAAPAPYIDTPRIYKNLGLLNGSWRIQIWPSPSAAFTMGGSGKAILNTYLIGDVTGVAPFSAGNTTNAANPDLDYFPDGVVEDVLFEGVMADVDLIQGDKDGARAKDASFEAKIKLLAAEEADAAKDNTPMTTRLPRLVRKRINDRLSRPFDRDYGDTGRW